MKNGCTVTDKELENSSFSSGRYSVKGGNLLLFVEKSLGLSEGCNRTVQRTTTDVFSTSGSPFFVLIRNGAKRENRKNYRSAGPGGRNQELIKTTIGT